MQKDFRDDVPMVGDYIELDYLQGVVWEITDIDYGGTQKVHLKLVVGNIPDYAAVRAESIWKMAYCYGPLEVLAIAGHIPGMDGVKT